MCLTKQTWILVARIHWTVWHLSLRESSLLAFFYLYFPQVLALLILTLVSIVSLSVLPPTVFHSHPCLWRFKMIFRFFRVKSFSQAMNSLRSYFFNSSELCLNPNPKHRLSCLFWKLFLPGLLHADVAVGLSPWGTAGALQLSVPSYTHGLGASAQQRVLEFRLLGEPSGQTLTPELFCCFM